MIKELVLASMMSFSVGIGTMQHEPMQKVEPNTIYVDTVVDNEGEIWKYLYEFAQQHPGLYNTNTIVKTYDDTDYINTTYDSFQAYDVDEGRSQYYFPNSTDNQSSNYYKITIIKGMPEDTPQYTWEWLDFDDNDVVDYKFSIQNEQLYNFVVSQQMAESGTMGTQIINNIKNGLGMIRDLASEFLVGFTALFWNSTQNQLTVFGIFSLVMLGIAITMAVVKLCMNLIRNNTGV